MTVNGNVCAQHSVARTYLHRFRLQLNGALIEQQSLFQKSENEMQYTHVIAFEKYRHRHYSLLCRIVGQYQLNIEDHCIRGKVEDSLRSLADRHEGGHENPTLRCY